MQVRKNPQADTRRNSLIFFQLGLIIVLTITYAGLEWKFDDKNTSRDYVIAVPDINMEDIPITEVNNIPPPPPPPPPIPEVIEVVADNLQVEETEIQSTESHQAEKIEKVIQVAEIVEEKIEEKVEEVPFVLIEEVPLYPGCEKKADNTQRKNCMSAKINELVKHEFNTGLGEKLSLNGINRIYVFFKIDEYGKVTDIKTRGPHKALEAEAERVVKLIPQMKPGKQRNKPVSVLYTLPIVFDFHEM
ncbi:MAG: energy transducer TonB [Christiangramia sp.]